MARKGTNFHWREAGEVAFGYSQAVRAGSLLFISGTMSVDENFAVLAPDDAASQMNNIYNALRLTLEHFGASFEHVVEEVIYTTDMAQMLAANEIRRSFYEGVAPPAATAIEVKGLAFDGQVLEIKAIAHLD